MAQGAARGEKHPPAHLGSQTQAQPPKNRQFPTSLFSWCSLWLSGWTNTCDWAGDAEIQVLVVWGLRQALGGLAQYPLSEPTINSLSGPRAGEVALRSLGTAAL